MFIKHKNFKRINESCGSFARTHTSLYICIYELIITFKKLYIHSCIFGYLPNFPFKPTNKIHWKAF